MGRKLWFVVAIGVVAAVALALRGGCGGDATRDVDPARDASRRAGGRHVRLAPRFAATIAGTVHDEAGAPIADASVCARAWSDPREVACVASDGHGTYRIGGLAAGSYQLAAIARSFRLGVRAPWLRLAAGERRDGIDVVLRAGGVELTGSVTDAGGGAVAHARVWIVQTGGHVVVEADEHGRFAASIAPDRAHVIARADGYATADVYTDAPSEVAIVVMPESTLGGVVVDAATGAPVAGVAVTIVAAAPEVRSTIDDGAVTDELGRFQLARLEAGRYLATARAPHGFGQDDASVALGVGEHVDGRTIRLYAAQRVSGRVVDITTATACADTSVTLHDRIHDRHAAMIRDADGELHADGVLPGTYVPLVVCRGARELDAYEPIVVADRDVLDVVWPVTPGSTIRGRVRSARGEPVESARVVAVGIAARPRDPVDYASAVTDRRGEYVLRGLRPGRYEVSADPRSSLFATITRHVELTGAEAIASEFVFTDELGTLVGEVRDTTGRGVADVRVRAYAEDRLIDLTTTDARGAFRFPSVRAGSVQVSVFGDASTREAAVTVVVGAGAVARVQLVVAPPAGTVRGRVVDRDGAPITDAFVSAVHQDGEAVEAHSARVAIEHLVDADGTFTVRGLGAGPFTVRAHRRSGGEAFASNVAVDAEVTLRIAPTASLVGAVRDRRGPLDSFTIAIVERGTGDSVREERVFRSAGRFALRDVPAGRYTVHAKTGAARRAIDVELVAGGELALEVELEDLVTITGRAVELRTSRPIAGLEMSATYASSFLDTSGAGNTHITDDAGRFELVGVPRGHIAISGSSRDDGARSLRPVTTYRTIAATGDVIDIGDIPVASEPKEPVRASLGFDIAPLGSDDPPRAARVSSLDPDSDAARAGLVVGDVITAIDGIEVTGDNVNAIVPLLAGAPGDRLVLALERGATVTIVVGS